MEQGGDDVRNIQRQVQDLWFCEVTEINVGIDLVKQYSKPEKHRFSVSATAGYVNGWGAGFVLNYDRYITSFDRDFKPKEGMMVFVDVVPELGENGELVSKDVYETDIEGNTVLDEDGNPVVLFSEPVTAPDYMLKRIYDTKKGKVARYGLEKV